MITIETYEDLLATLDLIFKSSTFGAAVLADDTTLKTLDTSNDDLLSLSLTPLAPIPVMDRLLLSSLQLLASALFDEDLLALFLVR